MLPSGSQNFWTAIILSAVLLNESMDIYSIVGAVLVLGSTFVSELSERK